MVMEHIPSVILISLLCHSNDFQQYFVIDSKILTDSQLIKKFICHDTAITNGFTGRAIHIFPERARVASKLFCTYHDSKIIGAKL